MDQDDRYTHHGCSGFSHSGARYFEIHVRGHLDSKWLDWLEGLEAQLLDNGDMILCGTLVDQAALMGVLNKLSGLNLTLLSVSQVNQSERDQPSKEAQWKTHGN